jgi:hypothetical protein
MKIEIELTKEEAIAIEKKIKLNNVFSEINMQDKSCVDLILEKIYIEMIKKLKTERKIK